ncbi:MAG TPA: glutamate racemase [Burkholderiaceae bacterium]|nr:glutamate racemase [Burkholderiaceae bacterium]
MTPPAFDPAAPRRIGIFDSGVGGLSVLAAIRAQLPDADLLYVADTGHAPYGDRGEEFVCDRSRRIARFLLGQGAGVLVVACNTATAAAVAALRQDGPDLAIVGVEPGIKPAVALSRTRRVGVLATTGTLASAKFRRLAEDHAAGATLVLQPCPGLADAIEASGTDAADPLDLTQDDEVAALVDRYCQPLRAAEVDVAVLGCTHYVFARAHFERALPGVTLLDTAEAVARQTARLAGPTRRAHPPTMPARLRAWSSGDPAILAGFMSRWLHTSPEIEPLAV